MADRTIRAIIGVDYEGGSATRQARDDLREVDDAAREASDGLEKAAGGFDLIQAAAVGAVAGIVASKVNFQSVKEIAQDLYEGLKEGAEFSKQRAEFDALAESIGTTAEALQSDLVNASGGLITSAEAIAGAGEIMSLGLAKTHDEAVALSEVAGRLGWDMQILGQTITNESTMRLDALGLSVEGVTSRLADLEAQGMSSQEAFKWAIIEEGREKIELVGDVADTAAGKIAIMEAATREAQQQFALGAAEGFAEALGLIADNAALAGPALGALGYGIGNATGEWTGRALAALYELNPQFALMTIRQMEAKAAADAMDAQMQGRMALYMGQRAALEEYTNQVREYGDTIDDSMRQATSGYGQIELPKPPAPDPDGYWSYFNIPDNSAAWELQVAQIDLATAAAQTYAEQIERLNQLGGDYFTQFSGESGFDFAQQLYDTADAAGAPLGALRELAIQYGLMDEATADAATAAAQTQVIMDTIAEAVRTGTVPWEDYAAAVEAAQQVISGDLTIPEISDLGDYGYSSYTAAQEAEREGFELKIGADISAVETAVTNAEGIVTGFTSPETVYEAVMDLNIEAVRTNATEATDLIVGIPNEKTVTINFAATGTQILEELRAIGAIP